MPPLVVGVAVGFAAAAATTLTLGAVVAIGVAAAALSHAVLQAIPTAPAPSAADQGSRQRIQRSPNAPHEWVYGKTVKSGVMIFYDETGEDRKYAHLVIALAPHECKSIGTVYFNDKPSYKYKSSKFRIKKHLGSPTQLADPQLVAESSRWTSAHKLSGICYVYVRFEYDRDVFPNGLPNVKVEIEGKSDIYDPRDGAYKWTDNPALCIRDYLMHDKSASVTSLEMDEESFIASANICDELVPTINGQTEKRFTLNGVVSTSTPFAQNIKAMLTSMGGRLGNTLNGFSLIPGVYQGVPDVHITEDNLAGKVSFRTRTPRKELFNTIQGQFVDPQSNYLAQDFPVVKNDQYILDDGNEEIVHDIDLAFTTSAYTAQRLARLELAKNRNGLVVDLSLKISGLLLTIGQNCSFTFPDAGWIAKEFVVVDWKYDVKKGVTISLREENIAAYEYADGILESYTPPIRSTFPLPGDVPPPTSLILESVAEVTPTGHVNALINARWAPPAFAFIKQYDVQWSRAGTNVWQSRVTSEPEIRIMDVIEEQSYDLRVRAISDWDSRSEWLSGTHIVAKKPGQPDPITNLTTFSLQNRINVIWQYDATNNPDISHFEIRASITNNFNTK